MHGFDEHFIAGFDACIVIAIENTKFGKISGLGTSSIHLDIGMMFSWLVFRAPDLDFVYRYLRNLIGLQGDPGPSFLKTKPYPISKIQVHCRAFRHLVRHPCYPG